MILRIVFLAVFAIAAAFTGTDLYLRHGLRLATGPAGVFEACAYVLIAVLAVVALAAAIGTIIRRAFGIAIVVVALAGIVVAGRETWLRYFPRRGWDCGRDLDAVLRFLPGASDMEKLLGGVRDCAHAHWHLLGFASDEWALAGFVVVGVLALLAVRH